MKRVYIQIIDPLNGTCVNACHEYPSEYHQAMDEVLRQYVGINVGYTLKRVDVETTFPGDASPFKVLWSCIWNI